MNSKQQKELFEKAVSARKNSYSPYSHYKVGSALLCQDGTVFLGCNIENAAYTPTVCAERVALFKAISEGKRSFKAIAVAGGKEKIEACTPCGVCRQVMAEFCDSESFEVIFFENGELKAVYLSDLLPKSFSPLNLNK